MKIIIPNLFTLGNLVSGIASMYFALQGEFDNAAYLIFLGTFLDGFDGYLARKLNVESAWGVMFDDISDMCTFGMAAGVLIVSYLSFTGIGLEYALVMGVLYALAIFTRLLDFTINIKKVKKGLFRGMPSPAGAMLIASIVLLGINSFYFMGLIVLYTIASVFFCLTFPKFTSLKGLLKPYAYPIILVVIAIGYYFGGGLMAFAIFLHLYFITPALLTEEKTHPTVK